MKSRTLGINGTLFFQCMGLGREDVFLEDGLHISSDDLNTIFYCLDEVARAGDPLPNAFSLVLMSSRIVQIRRNARSNVFLVSASSVHYDRFAYGVEF
jgi:hypothetical protein